MKCKEVYFATMDLNGFQSLKKRKKERTNKNCLINILFDLSIKIKYSLEKLICFDVLFLCYCNEFCARMT